MSSSRHVLLATAALLAISCGSEAPRAFSDLSTSQSRAFTVLTYNVQARPVLDRQRARRNLPKIGMLLRQFDVVGAQECFANCKLLLEAADHPSKAYFSQRKRWWSLANSGLAALGRLPLLEVRTEFYDERAELADRVASKGILLTRYALDDVLLDVYDTHMQAGHSAPAAAARRGQADQLVRFVSMNSPPEHAVIVLGDFNMGPHRPGRDWQAYEPLHYSSASDAEERTTTFRDMMQALQLSDASDSLFGPRYDHIDRILFRSPAGGHVVPVTWEDRSPDFVDEGGRRLSDGAPIAVQFSFSRS